MRRRECLVGGLLAAAGGSALAQLPSGMPRMALVVGNWAYESHAKLATPTNDMAAMSSSLKGAGFAVQEAANLTDRQFQWAVEEFARKVGAARALGLVYLSGHGLSLQGSVRFLGVGASKPEPADLERESTNLAWILSTMQVQRRANSSRAPVVLIADITSDDPFAKTNASAPNQALTKTLETERGSYVLLASYPGTLAGDAPDVKLGLMTKHLAPALQVDGLSLAQIATRVRGAVRRESTMGQIPWSTSVDLDDEQIVLKPSVMRDDPKARGRSARGG